MTLLLVLDLAADQTAIAFGDDPNLLQIQRDRLAPVIDRMLPVEQINELSFFLLKLLV